MIPLIPQEFLFFSLLLLSFLSVDEFGLGLVSSSSSNHHQDEGDFIDNNNNKVMLNSNRRQQQQRIIINNSRKTKDSYSKRSRRRQKQQQQKFLQTYSENEWQNKTLSSYYTKRESSNSKNKQKKDNIVHFRKQYVTRPRIHSSKTSSQNPSNWKLDWDKEWTMEFAAGLASLHILPDGKHVTAYLGKLIKGRFVFLNDKKDSSLSLTVTPCMSILKWSVSYLEVNETNYQNISLKNSVIIETFRTQRLNTFRIFKPIIIGIYMVEIRSLYADTFVQILMTTSSNNNNLMEPFSSAITNSLLFDSYSSSITANKFISFSYNFITASQIFLNPQIKSQRLRGNRLHVKWDSSPLNPLFMEYCIVVNMRRDYSTLCEAQGDKYGILPPNLMDLPYYIYQSPEISISSSSESSITCNPAITATNSLEDEESSTTFPSSSSSSSEEYINDEPKLTTKMPNQIFKTYYKDENDDFIIGCIGQRTNYILTDLKEGRLYYFNVFMRDLLTNLTYPYVRTTLKYRTPKNDSTILRDSKPVKIKLNKTVQTITLQFFLKKHCTELTMYVMPCGGGTLTYEIFNENQTLLYQSTIVENLDIIKTAEVTPGKYYITIRSSFSSSSFTFANEIPGSYNNNNNNKRPATGTATMVEVYLSKKNKKFPLPKLPDDRQVIETNEKSCDYVTIQWWASPDPRDNEYCIFLKLEERKRLFKFKIPNQCDVERSLRNDPYVSHSMCIQISPNNNAANEPLSQNITGLLPGKTYVLQLIVRRHKRKALSYNLSSVSTLKTCTENDITL